MQLISFICRFVAIMRVAKVGRSWMSRLLIAVSLAVSLVAAPPAMAESAGKALGRITRQAKDNYDRVEDQTKTNAKHLGHRVGRDIKNTVRLFTESSCDRVGRKKGPEAKRRCEAQQKEGNKPEQPGARFYNAGVEVDCWKPGRSDRWGTAEVRVSSRISLHDARKTITDQTSMGRVCRDVYQDENLRDGKWRWLY